MWWEAPGLIWSYWSYIAKNSALLAGTFFWGFHKAVYIRVWCWMADWLAYSVRKRNQGNGWSCQILTPTREVAVKRTILEVAVWNSDPVYEQNFQFSSLKANQFMAKINNWRVLSRGGRRILFVSPCVRMHWPQPSGPTLLEMSCYLWGGGFIQILRGWSEQFFSGFWGDFFLPGSLPPCPRHALVLGTTPVRTALFPHRLFNTCVA